MAENKITQDDIYRLVLGKMNNPDMELRDLYRQIDDIHPSTSRCYYVYVVIIWLILLGAVSIALFQRENDLWMRIVYIVYVLDSAAYCYVLKKYKQTIWPRVLLVLVVAYIVLSPTVTITTLVDILKSLVGIG